MSSREQYLEAFAGILQGVPNRDDGECRGFCPVHEDPNSSKSPSASFNFQAEVWYCHSCEAKGSFRALKRVLQNGGYQQTTTTSDEESNVIPITGKPLPTVKQLKIWHKRLLINDGAKVLMTERRGLTVKTMEKYLIGYDGQRFTIPIFDANNELVNVRRYKPNARSHSEKMRSYAAGYGSARLYGIETLGENEEILLTEGEMDRLIALQYGLPAVTHTGGAATFKAEWANLFKGKVVYIAYDEDVAGDKGATTAAKILQQVASAVYRVRLGTDIKGGDITDFFVLQGKSKKDLLKVMQEATVLFKREESHKTPTKGKKVSVEESKNASNQETLELTAMISGIFDPPYLAPRKIFGHCDQMAGPGKCTVCPFAMNNGERTVSLDPDDERLLKFIDVGEKGKHDLLVKLTEARCSNHVEFEVQDEWNIEQMAITPSVAHRSDDVEAPIQRIVYNVGTYKTPVNQLARIVGKQVPDPRTQRGTFMGWDLKRVNTDLDTFKMTPELKKKLSIFRPVEGQTPLEKCNDIADDLSANVSKIYGRPMLHVGYDLVWHSATAFEFEGKVIPKGWLECLVIGDTRTGKSETAAALSKHYQSGIVKSLEGASFAGLVGGAQQIAGKNWMITWGLLPLNDRRLVVLDEMSGLFGNGTQAQSKGIIEAMSSIRSDGKAQITKITTEETSARTRLIWISNPLSSTPLNSSSGGCLPALRDLVKNPEDIARFDYVMAVTGDDVPSSVINSTKHRKVKHRYTSDLSRQLVMWVWSRRADQVKFLKGVEEYIYGAAEDLGSRYVPDPPLVQIANVRVKVARLAVAIAARTFSSSASGEDIVVKRIHVKSAVEFLDSVYAEESMGYKVESEKIMENHKRGEKAKDEAREYLKANPHLIEVLFAVGANEFRKRDFEEFGGVDKEEANVIIARLLVWRLIARKSKGYLRMEPALFEVLRELEAEGS